MAAYTVRPGDTLESIADSLGTDTASLLQANPTLAMSGATIVFSGQTLNLPDGVAPPLPDLAPDNSSITSPWVPWASPTISADSNVYQIQPGDTLTTIARKQDVRVEDILRANPSIRHPNRIAPGTTLHLPAGAQTAKPPLPAAAISTVGTPASGFAQAPHYNQYDPRWGGDLMNGGPPLRRAGCLVSSLASALAAKNIRLGKEQVTATPKSFNAWLNSHGGYVGHGNFVWGSVTALSSRIRLAGTGLTPSAALLRSWLDAGDRAILAEVTPKPGHQHWILLTHYQRATFYCMDPGYGRASYPVLNYCYVYRIS